jgi:ABC-type transporter Mla subunit MlaD
MRLPPVPGPRDLVALLEVVPRVTSLVDRAEALLDEVQRLVRRIEATRQSAAGLVERFQEPTDRLEALLDRLEPPLTRLAPTLEQIAATTGPREVDALVELVDTLPKLVGHVEGDVLPMLTKLGSVAPDMHDLLEVSRELNEMIAKLPGMGRIRRRVDEELSDE